MYRFTAVVPAEDVDAANTGLDLLGFGSGNNIWEPGVFGWEIV